MLFHLELGHYVLDFLDTVFDLRVVLLRRIQLLCDLLKGLLLVLQILPRVDHVTDGNLGDFHGLHDLLSVVVIPGRLNALAGVGEPSSLPGVGTRRGQLHATLLLTAICCQLFDKGAALFEQLLLFGERLLGELQGCSCGRGLWNESVLLHASAVERRLTVEAIAANTGDAVGI